MGLLVPLFTYAKPWVPRRALWNIDLPSALFALRSRRCALLLALGFGLGVLSGCFLVCDVGWEIKGDRVLAALGLHVCSALTRGNGHVPVYQLDALKQFSQSRCDFHSWYAWKTKPCSIWDFWVMLLLYRWVIEHKKRLSCPILNIFYFLVTLEMYLWVILATSHLYHI